MENTLVAILPFRNDEYTKEFLTNKSKCLILDEQMNIKKEIKTVFGYNININNLIDLGQVYDINNSKIKLYSIDLSEFNLRANINNCWLDIYECMESNDIYIHTILNKLSVVKRLRRTFIK